jgi:hypothetical protein
MGVWKGRFDLLTPYSPNLKLQAIESYLWPTHSTHFTVTHALGFSVFTSRILATDFITVSLSLQITHEVFYSPLNFFLHILQLPFPKTGLNSNPLLPSSYPGRLASRNSAPFYAVTANFGTLLYNHFPRITQKTQTLNSWDVLCTSTLHSNGSYSIVACVFISAGICLRSRYYVTIRFTLLNNYNYVY